MASEVDENDNAGLHVDVEEAAPLKKLVLRNRSNIGISATIVVGGILGLLWLNRGAVSTYAINWALASKGVESRIDVKEINANSISFQNLEIGKRGDETIIAKNGRLNWHYDFSGNGLIIEDISAQDVFGHFAINKNGLDFRALTPLLKTRGSQKPLIIKSIQIENAAFDIDTDYGLARANFDLNGTDRTGILANGKIFAPRQFLQAQNDYDRPILLGIKTSPLNNGPTALGISMRLSGQSFSGGSIFKDLAVENASGAISSSIVLSPKSANRNNPPYIAKIYPSKLNFGRFEFGDSLSFSDANLDLKDGYFNPSTDWNKNSIFTLAAEFGFANGRFANQVLGNSKNSFEIGRAANGTSSVKLRQTNGSLSGALNAGASETEIDLKTVISRLDNILGGNLAGQIAINSRLKNARLGPQIANTFSQMGFADLNQSLGLKINSNFSKSEGKIWLGLNGPMQISGAQNSAITFMPIARRGTDPEAAGLMFLSKGGAWQANILARGTVNGRNNSNMRLNSTIEAINWRPGNIGIILGQTDVRNFSFGDTILSGAFKLFEYSNQNSHQNGRIKGSFDLSQNGKTKILPSRFDINSSIYNNHGELELNGLLREIDADGINIKAAQIGLSGGFDLLGVGANSRILGDFRLKNSTQSFNIANVANGQNIAINSILKINFPTSFNNPTNGNFSAQSQNFDISANSINSKSFNAQDFSINTPFDLSGKIGNQNGAIYKAVFGNLNGRAKSFVSSEIKGNNFAFNGPAQINGTGNQIAIMGSRCLNYSIDNLILPTSTIGKSYGQICPDSNAQFAQISNGRANIYAKVDANNFQLQMGDLANGQSLDLGHISANFTPTAKGDIGINVATNRFVYRFKSGPETWAIIESSGAKIDVNSNDRGSDFKISLNDLLAKNLPILASGSASANFHTDATNGLSGNFNFSNILISDSEKLKRFGDLTLDGSGRLANNQIAINAQTKNTAVGAPIAAFSLSHNLNNGVGNIAFEAVEVDFSPYGRNGLSAMDVVPALQGIVEDAYGKINGNANFSWAPNKPIQSNGVFSTDRFDFLSPLGPAEKISGTIALADLLQLKTETRQDLKVGSFNPGLPILNGTVGISFPGDNSVQLEEASWPFADGKLSLRPANWPFDAKDRDLTIDVEDIDIAKFLLLTKIPNLEIDGRMSGFLPIEIRDNNVAIVNGVLRAKEGGGTFRYTGPDIGDKKIPKAKMAKLKERFFGKAQPQGVELAINTLRDLKYKVLEIKVDGRIAGELTFGILLEGYNEEIFDGHIFRFNIKIKVPMVQAMEGVKSILDPNKQFNFLNPDGSVKDGYELENPPTQPAPTQSSMPIQGTIPAPQ